MTEPVPTDKDVRIMMFRALEQMFLHSEASTEFISTLNSKVVGINAVAEVVDDNAAGVQLDRQIAAQKELISHLFEKSHQYVTVVIAGAFAAYFTTLGTLASRFSDVELRWSALLMTASLTVFVMWEVFNIFYIGHHTFKGDYGSLAETPKWSRRAWYIVMIVALGTAVPAIGLSLWVYLRGLGVGG